MTILAAIQAPEKISERDAQLVRKHYPNFKVIVLNDDYNTFEHVSTCLIKYIPDMSEQRAWGINQPSTFDGLAIVWVGPQEQAELYHAQLKQEQLTMAPLETA